MHPKANSSALKEPAVPGPRVSGTLIIVGILTLAVAAAGTSWWFRYTSTHRAAKFWGPKVSKLIRDAPEIRFTFTIGAVIDEPETTDLFERNGNPGNKVTVSKAKGMAHLRNALLEDPNFVWNEPTPKEIPPASWKLTFRDPATNEEAAIGFTKDCGYCGLVEANGPPRIISCAPIRSGLWEMFTEFTAVPPIVPPEYR
jgi:hypothetical protein